MKRQVRSVEQEGVRRLEVFEPRQRHGPRWRWRHSWGVAERPIVDVLAEMPQHERDLAARLLREGIGRRRRWPALVRKPPPGFFALAAEEDVVPTLLRGGALETWDRWNTRERMWRLDGFTTTPAGLQAIEHRTPEEWRSELASELRDERLLRALECGPTAPMRWDGFAIVLCAAQRWLDMVEHGTRPDERELAGLVADTKALRSPARRQRLAELVETAPEDLFDPIPRIINLRGALDHGDGDVWDTALATDPPKLRADVRAIFCVENLETFRRMSVLKESGAVVLQVPGGPPPAEVLLLEQLHVQAPTLPVFAVFDPDPAGIRIATILQERSGVALRPDLMSPELLALAPERELGDWDRAELERLDGHAGPFEPLRSELARREIKAEQEPINRQLVAAAQRLLENIEK